MFVYCEAFLFLNLKNKKYILFKKEKHDYT